MITYDRAHELFEYRDGKLYRRIAASRMSAGTEAGTLDKDGYRRVKVDYRKYRAHRVVWLMHCGSSPAHPSNEIDHINGVKDDNRIENLRVATRAQNCQNKQRKRRNNTSGSRGVIWLERLGKYQAQIGAGGAKINLGYFTDIEDAKAAYAKANKLYFGEFGGSL